MTISESYQTRQRRPNGFGSWNSESDTTNAGVQLEMRRSTMMQYLAALLREKVITSEDLDGFSDELRNTLLAYKWD